MATLADLRAQVEAAILAVAPACTFPTDPVTDDVPIGGGATIAQVSALPAIVSNQDLNTPYTIVSIRTRVAHLINWPATTVEQWMEGVGGAIATLLVNPLTYQNMAAVHESNVGDSLKVQEVPDFDGHACWFEVAVQVALAP